VKLLLLDLDDTLLQDLPVSRAVLEDLGRKAGVEGFFARVKARAEALFREALAHPDGRGLALLALAHRRWRRGEDPVPLFKEVLKEARRLPNPYLHHLALSSLALYLWPKAPRKVQALSQHLLYHTHKTGFLVHLEVARLLRAQLLLETGERVDHLLGFAPSLPLTRAWKAALQGQEAAEDLEGYGILGRWVRRLWRRGAAWTRARRWS